MEIIQDAINQAAIALLADINNITIGDVMGTYKVKDSDGATIEIKADKWECGGNGLKFYRRPAEGGRELIAWFMTWQYFIKVTQKQDNEPQLI